MTKADKPKPTFWTIYLRFNVWYFMPFLPYVILIIDQTTETNPETGWDERKKDLIKVSINKILFNTVNKTKIAAVSCYISREHLQQIQSYIKGQDKFSHP